MEQPILLAVDDDATVLSAVTRDQRRRYSERQRVLQAGNGPEALVLLRRLKLRGSEVALLTEALGPAGGEAVPGAGRAAGGLAGAGLAGRRGAARGREPLVCRGARGA